jgi:predicted deacetylase
MTFPSPVLVVSVHDVAPATAPAARTWVRALDGCAVPLTFLAVPGPWRGAGLEAGEDGAELVAWLRARQNGGDEISLHGWCHRADIRGALPRRAVGSVVARGAAELWALDRSTAADRARAGLEVLQRNGLSVTGSTPPGWLSSRQARRGLADAGLQYVTDHAGLLDLVSGRRWWAPALCHRPCTSTGIGDVTLERLGRRVVTVASRLVAAGRSVRIGLHPDDLEGPDLLPATVDAVRRCLAAGAQATTYAEELSRLRARA